MLGSLDVSAHLRSREICSSAFVGLSYQYSRSKGPTSLLTIVLNQFSVSCEKSSPRGVKKLWPT